MRNASCAQHIYSICHTPYTLTLKCRTMVSFPHVWYIISVELGSIRFAQIWQSLLLTIELGPHDLSEAIVKKVQWNHDCCATKKNHDTDFLSHYVIFSNVEGCFVILGRPIIVFKLRNDMLRSLFQICASLVFRFECQLRNNHLLYETWIRFVSTESITKEEYASLQLYYIIEFNVINRRTHRSLDVTEILRNT
jgi:hypothetical protein